MHNLKEKQIVYTSVTGQDPRLIKLNGTMEKLIPFHYLFTRLDVIIHVTVFYDREALGLWHGSMSWQDVAVNFDRKWISYYFHDESVLNR